MNHRRATTALLVSGVLTITACGDHRDNGSTNEQPATAVGPDPVSAWHVYYDLTHPDPDRLGGAVGSDPVSAWHDYYDLTHPDPDRVGGAVGSPEVTP